MLSEQRDSKVLHLFVMFKVERDAFSLNVKFPNRKVDDLISVCL